MVSLGMPFWSSMTSFRFLFALRSVPVEIKWKGISVDIEHNYYHVENGDQFF
jgi:hypothetical protein